MSLATDASKVQAARRLTEYCFDNIWNAPNSDMRANTPIYAVNPILQTGIVILRHVTMALPVTGVSYMVYAVNSDIFWKSFVPKYDTWYDLPTILNDWDVNFLIYDINGRVLSASGVCVRIDSLARRAYVCVPKGNILATGNTLDVQLYVTCVKDTLASSYRCHYSFVIPKKTALVDPATTISQIKVKISNALAAAPCGTTVIQNGYIVDPTSSTFTMSSGDYIDVIRDDSYYGSFTVTVDDNTTGYLSTKYNGYREVIHCPKSLNPNNYLLTDDDFAIVVWDTDANKGIYYHRISDDAILSITHNDVSISRQTLNAFKAGLGAENIVVKVYVRHPECNKTITPDASFIADLYFNDDATIVNFLSGKGDATLPFWTADSLEQTSYVAAMYNDVEGFDPSDLDKFVEFLGYYTVAAVLSENNYTLTYTGSQMSIVRPYLMAGKSAYPIVYCNGLKIPDQYVSSGTLINNRESITLNTNSNVVAGDQIDITLIDGGVYEPIRFTPTLGSLSVTVDDPDCLVFIENTIETPIVGYERSVTKTYTLFPKSLENYSVIQNSDGTYSATFGDLAVGRTYLVQPRKYVFAQRFSIDDDMAVGRPLIYPLTYVTTDDTEIPVLGYKTIEVYLNGKFLIEGMDFIAYPAMDPSNGAIGLVDVLITNRDFLTTSGNVLEIITHGSQTICSDVGYCLNNVLNRTYRPSYWYPQISRAFVNGTKTDTLIDQGRWMKPSVSYDTASPFKLQTTILTEVFDVLSDYSQYAQVADLSAVDKYLGRLVPTLPSPLAVSYQHGLYSVFVAAIIYDISQGNFIPNDDYNDDLFMKQFSDYDYLKERDPTIPNNNPLVDLTYINVSAHYSNYTTGTPATRRIIQRLIDNTLNPTRQEIGDPLV